jgi:16S rRNA (guanine527-N7)-methyltransferase
VTTNAFARRLLDRAEAAGLAIESSVVSPIEAYYRLLTHWNRRINLTSLRLDPIGPEGLDRLFLEPLAAAPYVPNSPIDWIDLGSGGGSPALPLKIARPGARLTLIEARSRKAAFLREAVRELNLQEVDVLNDRFELSASREELSAAADLVTVRAVKVDDILARAVRHVLRTHGQLLLFSRHGGVNDVTLSGLSLTNTTRLLPNGDSALVVFKRDWQPS